ncbi:MAG: M67 family metallopeptidase [Solirubrobacterales bacterium]
MKIAKNLIDEIVAHSRDDLPNECCGLMGGTEDEFTSVHRARNAAATWLRYELHPTDQLRIMNTIEDDEGVELRGIYHSHTKSEAYPSQTDINLAAAWPDPLYLICSLADDENPVVRAFAIREGAVEEVDLDVV